MKKYILPAMIALLAACTQVEQESPETTPEPVVPAGYKVLTIKATKADASTKTSYAGDKTFSWCVGDKISVICNDGSANCWQTFTATTAAATSSFTATVPDGVNLGPMGADYKVAMYPASNDHVYSGTWSLKYNIPAERDFRTASGGHRESAIPMFAWGQDDDTYAFSNLTGAAKFTFSGVPCPAVKMTFTVPGVKLNGTFSLLYDTIDKANSSNVHWSVAGAGDESEKTVTYYADVTDGNVSFYLPYGEGGIWGYSTLTLQDAATDATLYSNTHVGNISITKNQIAVLPTLDLSFKSAFGIDWSGVVASANAHATYKAIKTLKATADDNYVYFYIEADPDQMSRSNKYDCRFRWFIEDPAGSTDYWGSEKYREIDSGHDKFAVKNGDIYFSPYGTTAYTANLLMHPSTWYYEIRMEKSVDAGLSGAGPVKIGVALDATYVDSEDNWGNSNFWYPYGVIPTYGTDMYDLILPSTLNIPFTEATGEVANPERGMMSYSKFTFKDDAIPTVKDIPLDYTGESLAFLLFYITDYMNKDLDAAATDFISAELDKVREANKKAVLRFAYTETHVADEQHEATPTQVLAHVDQVADILEANKDIIYTVQAGWLGTYGEWYYKTNNNGESKPGYTDYYLYTKDGSTVTDFNNNHKNLLDKLLTAVPEPIHIGLRTAFYKRYYLSPGAINSWTAITDWGTGANDRLGFFNDGIRGSDSDVGTFNSSTDWDMWYSQGNWLVCGGEMSYRSAEAFAALSDDLKDCDLSIEEMQRQHLSYLHYSESNAFMAKWIGEGRLEDLKKMLGYRLVLGDVNLGYSSLAADETVRYSIEIKNTGCAPVVYPRPFKLVLLHSGTPTVLADLGDIRDIAPGAGFTTLTGTFDLPAAITAGDKLAIWLPDNATGLRSNAAYSIRLANTEVTWDSGYNVLYTF